ncbi:hypothetical protein PR202_gb16871 [Eleusine coracana subsp. coracana]|uniref:Uncharacterized protein n=1 Tax=Eleusine coracana subsp. coracana TaxID=191504 RepID=A0AAV5F1F7_ELECO|nr:hypothetical protein PR202_gb16871 [Eleusine coracana subsp. coracana]
MHGYSIESLAPLVFTVVAPRIRKTRTISEAFENETWLDDIRRGGGLSWLGILEFLRLWDCIMGFELNDQEDRHIWTLDASGCYLSKSAYRAYFNGAITFEPWRRL